MYDAMRGFYPLTTGEKWAVGFDLPKYTPDGFGIPPHFRQFVVRVWGRSWTHPSFQILLGRVGESLELQAMLPPHQGLLLGVAMAQLEHHR